MKPYFLVLHNYIRLSLKKIGCGNFTFGKVQMIGRNSKLVLHKKSTVSIGNRTVSDGRFVIITDDGSSLNIGDSVYFNEDCMISCKGMVSIGTGCKFGPNVKIFDNNHCFSADDGVSDVHSKGLVEIGSGSWIGANCVILKGAVIGRNCVIGAGCVIDRVIPDGSIVTLNRDLVIRKITR